MQRPPALEEATRPNLDLTLEGVFDMTAASTANHSPTHIAALGLQHDGVIHCSDPSSPRVLALRIKFA